MTSQWRHNDHGGISDHRRFDYMNDHLFGRRSQKTSKLRVTGLCGGNPPVTGGFPSQRASNAEYVSIWWRHHGSGFVLVSHWHTYASLYLDELKNTKEQLHHQLLSLVWKKHQSRKCCHFDKIFNGFTGSWIVNLILMEFYHYAGEGEEATDQWATGQSSATHEKRRRGQWVRSVSPANGQVCCQVV